MLAPITTACLAPAALAGTAPTKPTKVTKSEYTLHYKQATKAASFVSAQITKLQVYAGTCKIVKTLGGQAKGGFDEALDIERTSLTDKLHEVNRESELHSWAAGLAARAAAYTGSHGDDVTSASQDIVQGLGNLSEALSKLILQTNNLAGLNCTSNDDLTKAITASGEAGDQLNRGFGELAKATPGVKPPPHK
jgi:hypothetical protein